MIQLAKPLRVNRTPHVHVVVPCYRYGHFLEGCVQSVISQPGVRTTVHIIDDASPDDSFLVAQSLAKRNANVRAERNESNLGHIATYNKGLAQTDSDYVVLLSADDQLAPGALQRATALLETHPEVGLVYGHPATFESEPEASRRRCHSWSIWDGQRWIDKQFRRGLNIIYSPEAVVRTSLHHQVGYYRKELPHSGDLEMWLRLAATAAVGRINGPDQAYRRIHPSSMMHTEFVGVLTDLDERRKAYEWFLQYVSVPSQVHNGRERIMRRRLAEEALGWAATARVGSALSMDLAAAVGFALRAFPDAPKLPLWRAASEIGRGGPWRGALLARQALTDKIRWRRWRHFGI